MVSLYRAWAAWRGMGGCGGGAPDATVQAGGVRFAAHARLLAAHSGYFKSVLLQAGPWAGAEPKSEAELAAGELGYLDRERRDFEARFQQDPTARHVASEEHVVYVPNVSAQQFWPLLAYMYTGYLELTAENIYQVLLAAHLLHMPRALELCRGFLAQGPAAPTTVVKPIASRKLPPYLPSTSFHPLHQEPPVAFARAQHETPFRPVDPTVLTSNTEAENTPKTLGSKDNNDAYNESAATSKHGEVDKSEAKEQSGEAAVKPRGSRDALNLVKTGRKPKVAREVADKRQAAASDDTATVKAPASAHGENKVVVDVACCDGPVRFHRVLNAAYRSDGKEAREEASDSEDSYVEVEEDSRPAGEYDNCNAFSKSLQKQMSENIRSAGAGAGEAVYTCAYCKHTFKSQYCYQKHARRHLNPVSMDAVGEAGEAAEAGGADGCCKARRLAQAGAPRREVRQLDMNVQYYPCKSCGCKFPSYYFVHKHRKLCHAEELEPEAPAPPRPEAPAPPGGNTDET